MPTEEIWVKLQMELTFNETTELIMAIQLRRKHLESLQQCAYTDLMIDALKSLDRKLTEAMR